MSINRYFRYIKLIFTGKVIFFIIISSVISNTILKFQQNRYETLYTEDSIRVEGVIVSNKQEREYKNRYKLKVLKVDNAKKYQSTQIYIDVKKNIKFEFGDKVILEGNFSKGNEQRNYGGFDYQLYLRSIKIYGILSVENYKKIASNNVTKIQKTINNIKIAITQNIEKLLDESEQEIVKGLILGDTTNLSEELKEKFQIANISHVLAVSGMHIIYIIIGIEALFKKILGKRKVKYLGILGLLFYMSITSFTSSIIRAGIMGIISLIAFLAYRKKDILNSIAISLLIILIENPYTITRSWITIILFRNYRNYYF